MPTGSAVVVVLAVDIEGCCLSTYIAGLHRWWPWRVPLLISTMIQMDDALGFPTMRDNASTADRRAAGVEKGVAGFWREDGVKAEGRLIADNANNAARNGDGRRKAMSEGVCVWMVVCGFVVQSG